MSEFAPEQPVAPVEPPVVESPVADAPATEPVVEPVVEEEHLGEITSIEQRAWTAQLPGGHKVIDLDEEWPTQDYENKPPAHVEFTTGLPVDEA